MHKLTTILCVMSVSLMAQWPNAQPRECPEHLTASPTYRPPRHDPRMASLTVRSLAHRRSYLLNAAPELKPEDIQPWAAALYKTTCR